MIRNGTQDCPSELTVSIYFTSAYKITSTTITLLSFLGHKLLVNFCSFFLVFLSFSNVIMVFSGFFVFFGWGFSYRFETLKYD